MRIRMCQQSNDNAISNGNVSLIISMILRHRRLNNNTIIRIVFTMNASRAQQNILKNTVLITIDLIYTSLLLLHLKCRFLMG